ncbi:putative membrane protein [Pseudomonas aeruginosa NCMG1179]|nr:putative membrane protein [Pseudomonas aeruginosa NCMG1179]
MYLWLKAFHIIAVVCWFAGLFYLPRLFVYHAMSEDQTSRERFCVMERKLYRGIMMPSMLATLVLGLWMLYLTRLAEPRLAARQADPGGPADRLPPRLRRHAQALRPRRAGAQPCVLPLVQRSACTVPAADRPTGGAQTFLTQESCPCPCPPCSTNACDCRWWPRRCSWYPTRSWCWPAAAAASSAASRRSTSARAAASRVGWRKSGPACRRWTIPRPMR